MNHSVGSSVGMSVTSVDEAAAITSILKLSFKSGMLDMNVMKMNTNGMK